MGLGVGIGSREKGLLPLTLFIDEDLILYKAVTI